MSNNAGELFKEGYNCAQAVVCSHCEKLGIDKETGAKMAACFGGGMGRLREVCGCVSGMFLLLSMKEGYTDPKDSEAKKALYEKVQHLAKIFEDQYGSLVCRELLGLKEKHSAFEPEKRTEKYYEKRPCGEMAQFASELFEKEILK